MKAKIKIIAEIGENHHGAWEIAGAMLSRAAACGADIVKFQSYLPEICSKDDPEYDWFCRVSLPDEKHFEYKEQAEKLGVGFMSAPFSVERARFLCEKLQCESIKVASGVLMNLAMLDVINENADRVKDVYVSTGMATVEEIHKALDHLNHIQNMSVLHCTSQYPASSASANLNCLHTLKVEFSHCSIGYSDHVVGLNACRTAAALGAEVLEKHFTFSRDLPGTDHPASMLPQELVQLRNDVDEIAELLGSARKEPTPEEAKIKSSIRNRFTE